MKKLVKLTLTLGLLALSASAFANDPAAPATTAPAKKPAAPAAKPGTPAKAAPKAAHAQPRVAAPKTTKAWSRQYGMAGCGLGSVVVGKKGGQIFAATTNGTVWSQYFGISFGTLNCVDGPNNEVAQRMDGFVAANKVALAGDMARGGGETLAHLSAMMGCDASMDDQFGATLKKSFGEIFPNHEVYPNEVTDSIITVIRNDQGLSVACKKIS